MGSLPVSVIIAARNAAATLGATLDSLVCQTSRDWEAVVVDDGSNDATAEIAAGFATRESRIRLLREPSSGVSAARNAGLREARFEWLLFLDADDWLLPAHLEHLTSVLRDDADLDAVHCGWRRVTADGEQIDEASCLLSGDLFARFAVTCAFAVHACIVRRSRVEAVGGFDPVLRTCEDWDLWQRVARTGARFARVPEVFAVYCVRQDSATSDLARLLADGLQVIARGHAPDPRIASPAAEHALGRPRHELDVAAVHYASWVAGLDLGRGGDPRALLPALPALQDPELDPAVIASSILSGGAVSLGKPLAIWANAWRELEPRVQQFLEALEQVTGSFGLRRRVGVVLEQRIAETTADRATRTLGATHAVHLEVTTPLGDVPVPERAERLHATLWLEGKRLGTLVLPAFAGCVTERVLADAIAARFAWEILGRFLEARGRQHTWEAFLQDLWNRKDWPNKAFYDAKFSDRDRSTALEASSSDRVVLEISRELPSVRTDAAELEVVATAGGVALDAVRLPVSRGRLRPQQIRAAINRALGYELCCGVVREGLVGKPLSDPTSLRERLAATERAGTHALSSGAVFGRRPLDASGTSASRRAVLPAGIADDIEALASATGQLFRRPASQSECIEYSPEWLSPSPAERKQDAAFGAARPAGARRVADRGHFESLFAERPDPWRYETDYERNKYDETLALVPEGPITRALEIGCAEGHFTAKLAARVGSLLAVDVSAVALERARRRCAELDNVSFERLDLVDNPLPTGFDLVVASEVLYYVGGSRELAAVTTKLAASLATGGHLLTAHANLVVDEPGRTGFDWDLPFGAKVIGDVLASTRGLSLIRELRTPLYRIQLFRREARRPFRRAPRPEIVERPLASALEAPVASHVLWNGGRPLRHAPPQPVVTEHLPILLYHRVAPAGSARLRRYRLSPEDFEEQLRYLRDAGYRSVTFDEWREAKAVRQPLPGRAVMITFDDGLADFHDHAWPLLRRYGFTACVFLVADRVGGTNDWDMAKGEALRLLAWPEIRALHADGVEFGSHAATHRPLTSFPLEEAAREAVRSMRTLSHGLGSPVRAVAYPHGETDDAIRHLFGACGYLYGLTCRPGRCSFGDDLLDLPRLEVAGDESLEHFVRKVEAHGSSATGEM